MRVNVIDSYSATRNECGSNELQSGAARSGLAK